MIYPSAKLEKELLASGYQIIAGLDEVGRGSWAGPVVAAAIIYDPLLKKIPGIRDSKLVTALGREKIARQLTDNFDFGIGVVASAIIDASGIVPATKLAMEQAIAGLKEPPQYLLIDALRLENREERQQSIIKGDQKILTIAAASIIAKVARDRLMTYYHEQYQAYGFNQHKGYGTGKHRAAIKKYGASPIHRFSYRPLRSFQGIA
jgi:ribonuclease HII